MTSTSRLHITYGKSKQGQVNVPTTANSLTSGFVGGTDWKPQMITVYRTKDNQAFKYFVSGVVEWSLFGVRLYSEPKQYEGLAMIP
ncbi:hypothetical protein [Rhabdobacter roseus]|nr:hypothetical protein [Rhabdobacter roseus]